jgi:hypothetical protein
MARSNEKKEATDPDANRFSRRLAVAHVAFGTPSVAEGRALVKLTLHRRHDPRRGRIKGISGHNPPALIRDVIASSIEPRCQPDDRRPQCIDVSMGKSLARQSLTDEIVFAADTVAYDAR